jgi:hypothetical protein
MDDEAVIDFKDLKQEFGIIESRSTIKRWEDAGTFPKRHKPPGAHRNSHPYWAVADWKPFGIERKINNQSFYRFFPGIEADTGTEPLEAGSFRFDIHGKLLAYLTICRERIYHSHFALPCFFIPFVTGSRSRMDHMMALLQKLTDGKGHSSFLFKTFPPLTSFQAPPPPSGAMLTEPWLRVGYPPLTLTEGS